MATPIVFVQLHGIVLVLDNDCYAYTSLLQTLVFGFMLEVFNSNAPTKL